MRTGRSRLVEARRRTVWGHAGVEPNRAAACLVVSAGGRAAEDKLVAVWCRMAGSKVVVVWNRAAVPSFGEALEPDRARRRAPGRAAVLLVAAVLEPASPAAVAAEPVHPVLEHARVGLRNPAGTSGGGED